MAPGRADVVTAIVGASAALAGFVLVFLGILVSSYQTLIGNATEATLRRFKSAAVASLAAFATVLTSVALSLVWLVADGGRCFYIAVLVAFFVALGTLATLASYVSFRVLLRG